MKFIEKAGKVAAILLAVIVLGLSFYIGYAIALNKYESMVGEKALASFIIEFSALKYLEMGNNNEDNAKKMLIHSLENNIVDFCEHAPSDALEKHRGQLNKLVLKFAELRKIYPPTNYGDGGLYSNRIDSCLKSKGS